MGMRGAIRGIVVAATIVGLTACTHRAANLSVGIVYSGGPNPQAIADTLQPGVVRVYRPDGSFVTSRHLRQGGTLRAGLPPGTYSIVAHSGDAGCRPASVNVVAGETRAVRIVCDVK